MSTVTITFEASKEADGYDSTTTLVRHNVDTVEELAFFYNEAAVAGGWTYIKSVALEKEDEEIVWSDF
jgi:hypothetical protein|tara:strand:- start:485 stop:688 length:204 start_codon:yes stop_codon:yes gene_type:complete